MRAWHPPIVRHISCTVTPAANHGRKKQTEKERERQRERERAKDKNRRECVSKIVEILENRLRCKLSGPNYVWKKFKRHALEVQ